MRRRCTSFEYLGRALADTYVEDGLKGDMLGLARIISAGQQVGRGGQG
jgi:hypothetical protein